jgi:hypothetical protein
MEQDHARRGGIAAFDIMKAHTGYGTTGLPEAFRGKPVLRKPFPIEQLRDA